MPLHILIQAFLISQTIVPKVSRLVSVGACGFDIPTADQSIWTTLLFRVSGIFFHALQLK